MEADMHSMNILAILSFHVTYPYLGWWDRDSSVLHWSGYFMAKYLKNDKKNKFLRCNSMCTYQTLPDIYKCTNTNRITFTCWVISLLNFDHKISWEYHSTESVASLVKILKICLFCICMLRLKWYLLQQLASYGT